MLRTWAYYMALFLVSILDNFQGNIRWLNSNKKTMCFDQGYNPEIAIDRPELNRCLSMFGGHSACLQGKSVTTWAVHSLFYLQLQSPHNSAPIVTCENIMLPKNLIFN